MPPRRHELSDISWRLRKITPSRHLAHYQLLANPEAVDTATCERLIYTFRSLNYTLKRVKIAFASSKCPPRPCAVINHLSSVPCASPSASKLARINVCIYFCQIPDRVLQFLMTQVGSCNICDEKYLRTWSAVTLGCTTWKLTGVLFWSPILTVSLKVCLLHGPSIRNWEVSN